MDFVTIMKGLKDPRRDHLKVHSLECIIYIAISAVIGGAESWYEVEEFGKMKESFFIENIALVGDGEKFVAAIIQPNFSELANWAKDKNINFQTNHDLTENLEIKQLFKDIISNFNTCLGKVEQVKDFILVDDEWSVDNELLTPTMKLRRKKIKEFYQKEINSIYNK